MTAKQFFKSTAFKCIAVLLSILLVCGILLTICNSLFYVSAEEKLARAISKIYGDTVTYEVEDVDGKIAVTSAQVLEVYDITSEAYENDYLLKVKGNGGYGGGSVTCWVRVNAAEDGATVKKITIDSNVGQSYITKITGGALGKLINKQENDDFTSFDTDGIKTGATFSMGAVSNAANGALTYINAKLGLFSEFYGFEYNDYLDDTTTVAVNGSTVEYSIVTQGGGIPGKFNITIHVTPVDGVKKITTYEITKNGSSPKFPGNDTDYATLMSPQALDLNGKTLDDIKGYIALNDKTKDEVINTGATISNCHCYYAAAFALANYDKALEKYSQGGKA